MRPFNVRNECCDYVGDPCPYGVRKIALMKNHEYFGSASNWSTRNVIVEIDPGEYTNSSSPDFRTEAYYMQVFRNGDDWWGLVGMYRLGDEPGALNGFPYTHPEYTSDVELMWSDDGEEWFRTNNRQPFIALHDSINSIYTVGTVVGDSVYFYSAESTILHANYKLYGCTGPTQDTAVSGKFFSIYLYKMSIDKLNEWRPLTIVELNCAVEGFLNTGTGKHNLKDTLTLDIRNSFSPYEVISSKKAVIDSVSFLGEFTFPHINPGNYYLSVFGRNSLETWTFNTVSISNGSTTTYDFTTYYNKAYGYNLVNVGSEYCIYSGDVNNDNIIDGTDEGLIENDIFYSVSGYVDTDLNGDFMVDISDAAIAQNNSLNVVGTISP